MAEQSTHLRRNAVGLGGAVIMSTALMGPAISMYFNPQVAAISAGASTPLVFLVALVIMLIVGTSIMEMARVLPSAGSFYTYVSRGIGPRAGFVTGSLMFLAYALLIPAEMALIGYYTAGLLQEYGISIPWWIISAIFLILLVTLSLRGIAGSIKTATVLFAAEVGVIVVLSTIVLINGGANGLTIAPLNPATSPNGISGIAVGLTFGILSFVGFEAATTLGEEVRGPRKNVPRAILLSTLSVGIIYVFCTYSEMIGFGTDNVAKLIADPAPFTTLAQNYAPWLQVLVGLAGVSSIFASAMNTNNGVVRIVFAMGREGLLPKGLGKTSPTHRSPVNAIWLVAILSVVLAFGLGLWVGPFTTYVYLGAALTFAIIPVYVLTAIACIRYFSRERRDERKIIRHIVLPIIGIAALAIPIIGSVYPVPAPPLNFFPYGIVLFILIVALVAFRIGRRNPEVLQRAGNVLASADVDEADPVEGAMV